VTRVFRCRVGHRNRNSSLGLMHTGWENWIRRSPAGGVVSPIAYALFYFFSVGCETR